MNIIIISKKLTVSRCTRSNPPLREGCYLIWLRRLLDKVKGLLSEGSKPHPWRGLLSDMVKAVT